MNEGIYCDDCGERIFIHEVLIMFSETRKVDNKYFHQKCFLAPLIDRVCKELKENRELVVMALFTERIK